MNTCFANESIDVSDAPCVPDVGPPVPVTWSDPQPSGVVITGYSAAGFDSVGGCPAGGATDIFDGRLPVRETASAFDLRYWAASLVPGTTPLLVQTAGTIVEVGFNTGSHWRIAFVCSTGFADIWRGIKTVGLTPIGTYMRVNGSATTPLCLVVAEQSFDWSTMVWVPTLVQPSGTASAVGVTNTFAVAATAATPVTNFGQILGTMTYTGPVSGARCRITVTGADTGGFSSFRVRVNGNTLTTVPATGFGLVGVTDYYFTIQNPASPGTPLVGATIEVRAIAQTNIVLNAPAFSGVLS